MYDAIIIGARCAGSPTAMLLARRGYKVLLLDKASFPSDTVSTHIIFVQGVLKLKRWGLLDKIIASNCPVIRKVAIDLGPFTLEGSPAPFDSVSDIIAPRRKILDQILVDAAVEAGSELRENCSVEEILISDGRVTGVRYRTKSGAEVIEKARMVIGADGRNSTVAKAVKAEEYHYRPKQTCWYYTYWSGVPIDALTMHSRPFRVIGCIPTNDDLVCMNVVWPANEFHTYRSDIEGNYMKTLQLVDGLSEIMRKAKREERFTGITELPGFFRKSYGPGWALVGDAAYHKDPVTGQGISDAFYGAEKLAEAIHADFSGADLMESALSIYESERDEKVMPMYDFTSEWAKLEPPNPEKLALFNGLNGNQAQINRFIGTVSGTIPLQEFFSPENIEQIIGATAA